MEKGEGSFYNANKGGDFMDNECVNVELNSLLVNDARKVIEGYGLSLEEGIMLFLYEVNKTSSIPFELSVELDTDIISSS